MGVFRESGVFDHFPAETWKKIEFQLKSLILATDITRQKEFLDNLKVSHSHKGESLNQLVKIAMNRMNYEKRLNNLAYVFFCELLPMCNDFRVIYSLNSLLLGRFLSDHPFRMFFKFSFWMHLFRLSFCSWFRWIFSLGTAISEDSIEIFARTCLLWLFRYVSYKELLFVMFLGPAGQ